MNYLLTTLLLYIPLFAATQMRPEYFRSNLTGDTLLGITEKQTINAGILYIYANQTAPALLKSARQEAKEWKDLYNDEVMASAFFALGYTKQLEATAATEARWRVKARKGRRRGLFVGLGLGFVGGFVLPKVISK